MRLTAIVAILAIVLSSCSSKYSLQKRRYTKGYYIAHSGKKAEQNVKVGKSENSELTAAVKTENRDSEIVVVQKAEKTAEIVTKAEQEIRQETDIEENAVKAQNFSFKRKAQIRGGIASSEKEEIQPPYQYGYGYSSGGMGAWGMIGAVSSIISLIFFLIYLAYILEIFTGGTMSGAIIAGMLAIIVVIAVVGIVLALSLGGV